MDINYPGIVLILLIGALNTEGENYLLAFPGSPYRDVGEPYVIVTGGEDGGVVRILTGGGIHQILTVKPFQSKQVSVPSWISSHGYDNKSLLISSDTPTVSIYGSLHDKSKWKTLSPLPLRGLGTQHTVLNCEELGPMNLILAAHNESADVTVTFRFRYRPYVIRINGTGYRNGDTFTFSLDEFQTFTFQSDYEFTGTTVTSSSSIAVFIEYESFVQLLPNKYNGFEYVISKAPFTTDYQKLQITTHVAETQILFGNGSIIYLRNLGTYRQRFEYNDTFYFTSDKPVTVSTCSGFYYLDIVPPTDMFPSSCGLPGCQTAEEIVILSYNTTQVQVSETSVSWSDIPGSLYRLGRASIATNSSLSVTSMSKFNLLSYCPLGPLFSYCGYNTSVTRTVPHDNNFTDTAFTPSKSYLFPAPGTEPASICTVAGEEGGGVEIRTQPNFLTAFFVQPYTSQCRNSLSWLVSYNRHDTPSGITTESSVSVYGGFGNRQVEYTPLDVDALGETYTVITCTLGADFQTILAISSPMFTVNINITLNAGTSVLYANRTYREGSVILSLEKYQTALLTSDTDMTGSVISSNGTIAVFVGQMASGYLQNYKQLFPQIHSGCDFIAVPDPVSENPSRLILLSQHDDLQLVFSTSVRVDMNSGGIYRQDLPQTGAVSFRTTKPVLAATCSAEGVLSILPPMHLATTECCVPGCPYSHSLTAVINKNGSLVYRNSTVSETLSSWNYIVGSEYKISSLINEPKNVLCFSSSVPFFVFISCPPSSSITHCGLNTSNQQPKCPDVDVFRNTAPSVEGGDSSDQLTERENWMIGAGTAMLLLFVILIAVLPYCLWKRRNIFIMKLVHKFQKYEDNDDRQFDAFISYCSTSEDEYFVVHTLFPKLEKEFGFSTCVHFRDFTPGETIANNIIEAVTKSRRTILVLSPNYIRSEFCRFEYQRAQYEMLQQKQRIIPILFQEIRDAKSDMDHTLKTILSSITYIEWPTSGEGKKIDQFWSKLTLSMPKRHPRNDAEDRS